MSAAKWIAVSGDWATATNWDLGVVPDGSTSVTIAAVTPGDTITASTATASSASLVLSGPITLSGAYGYVTGSVSLAAYSALTIIAVGGLQILELLPLHLILQLQYQITVILISIPLLRQI